MSKFMDTLGRAAAIQAEGKALAFHPALQGVDPVSTYAVGANRQDATLSQREAPRHMQAYGGAEAIDHVMNCVRFYADTASTADWHLERDGRKLVRRKSDDTPEDSEVGPADLYALLDQPNPFMDYAELVDLLTIDLLMVGNAYWLKWRPNEEGKPLALYRMAPAYVKIVPGPFGPKRFEYQPPGTKDPMKLDPAQVMHFRLPNPHSAYYGLGIIQGGGRVFDLEIALTDTEATYYEKKADPSLIVQSERRVPRDVFNKLTAQMRRKYSGSKNAGELMILEAGLKASTLSTSASEALFDKITSMNRDRILAMFRISALLLGYTSGAAGDQLSNARREFDTKTMRPFLTKLQRRVTAGLVAAWGVDFAIDYNYVLPPEELIKQVGSISALPAIKVREIRRQLAPFGIPESTGDPEIDEMILNVPGEELDDNGQGGAADPNLPGEAGRPPLAKNTTAFGTAKSTKTAPRVRQGKALTAGEVALRIALAEDAARIEGKAITLEEPANTSIGRKLTGEQRPQDSTAAERTASVDAAADFMRRSMLDAVHVLERGLLDEVEGKAFLPKTLVKRIRTAIVWGSFEDMIEEALLAGAERAASAAAIHQANLGRPTDDLNYRQIAKTVAHRPEGVTGITRTLKREVTQIVSDLVDEGKGQGDVQAAVQEKFRDWRDGKAAVVAITESAHAYNEATLAVAEATGSSQVMVVDGTDSDEACADADGSVWTLDHARDHRIEHPNCRRAFTILDE